MSIPSCFGVEKNNVDWDQWHIVKLVYTPYDLKFYIDGSLTWRTSRFAKNLHFCFNSDIFIESIDENTTYIEKPWFPRHACAIILGQQVAAYDHVPDTIVHPQTTYFDWITYKEFFTAPEITCPDLVCSSSSETATLDVDDDATDITWTLSPTSLFTGSTSGTGKTASIQGRSNYYGWGTITYSFEMNSGESFDAQKTFWVGPPDDQYLDMTATLGGDDKLIPGELNQIVASYTGPGGPLIDHNWGSYSGWPHFEVSADHSISFYTVPYNFSTYEDIYVSAQNTCGSSPIHTKRFYPLQYFYLSIYPNPANEYIELSIAPENEVQDKTSKIKIEKATGKKGFGEYTIEIRNEDGSLLKSVSSQKTNLQLSTRDLWPGRYFVHLITEGKVYKQQLIIEK